jgi:hypothetical protein
MTPTASILPDDDLGRTATIVHVGDPGLLHLGVGAGTYTICPPSAPMAQI